ncbi:hypothetical protein ACOMICROBIO_LMKGKHOH_04047 [Vibrio sp. B1FIG11]|uniref:HEPN domain-containing protein n=1 Tax=unclassified Vibrio TaxID=2614977 RepID=UPI001389CB00|nr:MULTISPECIES: HEPN domain-containing protein [unclassified Vibrio]NDJ82893.1 hypothetical protein [Vibrio sp. LB10LO1]CAD7827285.1 hypothetical protein ACOMICROBIO_LMKGKHOH_04047 [Vibrio sp. B1FIG11]CAE6963378.1 hypothetical protein ACOMICROBIO_LMKGKHOH_04047 [Vibrio sp. B1FIG11]
MQLSDKGLKLFTELLTELAHTQKIWVDDPKEYFNKVKKDSLISSSIDAPSDLSREMRTKWQNQEPCFYQLHHTARSLSIVRELAVLVQKVNNINCLPYELNKVIEAIVYEYVNSDLYGFARSVMQNGEEVNVQSETLKTITITRLSNFKKSFSASVFQFPVTMFNLNEELEISPSIRLFPVDRFDLTEKQLMQFKATRVFDYNYYLEVHVQTRCSKKLAQQLAEKARDATYNILKLLGTRLSRRAIPLLASNERNSHLFDFYRYGIDDKSMGNDSSIRFASFQFDSEVFWKEFYKGYLSDESTIHIAFEIPELLLIPNFSNQRVVERLERSLLWYGDASTEPNSYQQLLKLVSSLEALVNFREESVTKVFIRRISHLNINHNGLSDVVESKAKLLYKARSRIVHGGSIDERLDFCAIDFCSDTLLRAIYWFHRFGFEKRGFNNTLPGFLDDLPNSIKSDKPDLSPST